MREAFFLGVDGGGTKTLAIVADGAGELRGRGLAGSSNYHDCGRAGAEGQIRRALDLACAQAGILPEDLAGACFGLSGADRPKDFAFIRTWLAPLLPGLDFRLENDTLLALRAGSPEGVGVAVVAGTGSNVVGRNAAGQTLQVGGLGPICGDRGGAPQLGAEAVVAAFLGRDGRGPSTVLAQRIEAQLGLEALADIVELEASDELKSKLDLGPLAPLVFEAAAGGDELSQSCIAESVELLAAIIVNLILAVNPEIVVVGGDIYNMPGADELFLKPLKSRMAEVLPLEPPRIGFSDLGADACVRGAALFAVESILFGKYPFSVDIVEKVSQYGDKT